VTRTEGKGPSLFPEGLGREEQKYLSRRDDWSQMLSCIASEKERVARAGKR